MTTHTRPRHLARLVTGALGGLLALALIVEPTGHDGGLAKGSSPRDIAGSAAAGLRLRPPRVTVLRRAPGLAPGLIFLGAKNLSPSPGEQSGPLIVDDRGRPVWFRRLPRRQVASDVRVQSYLGRPVLTWWQGHSIGGAGHGEGEGIIADRSYHVLARVRGGHGYRADQHSFTLTPQGTALITAYNETRRDLSSVGGATNGKVWDGIVQEIDVATGRVLFEWHSLDHVPLDQSYEPAPRDPNQPYDYFHINSVSLDAHGNLLISSRHSWTVYDVDRHTGRILWRLGGKSSNFRLGSGVRFAWQHNPVATGDDTLRIFDNESNGRPVRADTRVITVRLHPRRRSATLLRSIVYPGGLSVPSQGNSERLPGGDLFVGWGRLGRFSELGPDGSLLFDATLPPGYDSYRAYRFPWSGHPSARPAVAARRRGGGTAIDAVWNGATGVDRWRILAGGNSHGLEPIASVPWNGLDTQITVKARPRYVAVVALDAAGRAIGRSAAAKVGP